MRTDGTALTEIVGHCGLPALDVATIDQRDALGSSARLDEHSTATVNGAKIEAMSTRRRRRTLDRLKRVRAWNEIGCLLVDLGRCVIA